MFIEELKQILKYYKSLKIQDAKIEELKDIRGIHIDTSLPVTERILSFIDQLDNPYMFKVGDINVKVSYNENGPTLQESLENILIKNLMQEFCHKNR